MEYVLVILAFVCAFVGVAGAILPALPGPPLSFAGLVMIALCGDSRIGFVSLLIAGVIAALITVLDYVAPMWITNKKGGSKYAMWGAGIGMIVGLFFGPLGVIAGPFIGAFIGEMLAGTSADKAFNVAFMSFIAFMLTTGIKFIYCMIVIAVIAVEGWKILWQ